MKKSVYLYLLGALIVAVVVVKIVRKSSHKAAAAKTAAAAVVIPAEIYIARDTSVEYYIDAVGSIRANEDVQIVSEISERLVSVNFTEGTFVAKDALLFKLDDSELKAQLEKLNVQEQLAADNEQRDKALLAKGGISQQAYDEALNRLKTIRAEIQLLKVKLDKTEIRAPFAGKIGLRNVSAGAFLTPSMVLTTLSDVRSVKVDFTIPERYAGNIQPGKVIDFITENSDHSFKAKVYAVEPGIDLNTRNLTVRALADNAGGQLFPGASVKVNLDLKGVEASLFLPTQCLVPSIKGYQVYLLKGGKASLTLVKTGLRTSGSVLILEGVSVGDTVVATNLLRMKPGIGVKILKSV